MTDVLAPRNTAGTRRAALSLLLGGSALLWHKPVVESIILPAHAQSTNDPGGSSSSGGSTSGSSSGSGSGSTGGGASTSSGSPPGSGSSSTSGGSSTSSGSSSSGSSGSGSSGSSSSTSSSGSSSSSGGSSGGDKKSDLHLATPIVRVASLTASACVTGCAGSEALVMIDIYTADGKLVASYQTQRSVAGDGCFDVTVTPATYGFESKSWPSGLMFVVAVSVAKCGLSDQTSGFL